MTATVLAEYERRAAHGLHICGYCRRYIRARERYLDQRIADQGTVYTFRAHLDCYSAYWSWLEGHQEETIEFAVLTPHLPPCWHAWDRDSDHLGRWSPFIGPRPPCTCEVDE